MGGDRQDGLHRADPRQRLAADLERRARRGPGGLGAALALIGAVGWPIALLGVGGALLGRLLDARLGTGVRLTLILLTLGVGAGAAAAWRAVRRPP